MASVAAAIVPARAGGTARSRALPAALIALALALVGLFGRLMTYQLRHDEQMYLPIATMLAHGRLYDDYGFNNLPNLPLLMQAVLRVTGAEQVLLAGRLTIFAGWLVAVAAMLLLVRRLTRSWPLGALAALLLLTHPLLLGPAGMLVTNNFLPLAFVLMATYLLIDGADRDTPAPLLVAASGLCLGIAAGFKANYVFALPPFAFAALLAPARLSPATRRRGVTLPFVAGGIVGALPPLAYLLSDPSGFVTHVLGYHSGPHVAYWSANADLDGAKVLDLPGKLVLAAKVWLISPAGLVAAALALAAVASWRLRDYGAARMRWPHRLIVALLLGGVLVSFVPSPAFPQYYAPPVPFAIVLAVSLVARLQGRARAAALLLLLSALLLSAPRLALGWPDAVRSARWTGTITHDQGQRLAALLRVERRAGTVATLAPLYAVEGGLTVPAALATGPLVYRVGDYVPLRQRRHYAHWVSPTTIDALLAASPPAAVLVGFEGKLDDPLASFARSRNYRAVVLPWLRDRYGSGTLYLAPTASISS
ncbi:hypothetical protein ACMGDM_00880 [Sphingomonas sp. DT-51]|uniref:glycosyltransferase family 39 protein n=1 Tax=Sphingomonas sp. DT-51 TaxID=3396165 RepID=UPI003F1C62D9